MAKDYYKILGVPRSASPVAIKQSYRALSKRHHPDVVGGDAQAMADLNIAYDTLSNPSKRISYNLSFKQAESPKPAQHKTYRPAPAGNTHQRRSPTHQNPKKSWNGAWAFLYFAVGSMAIFAAAFIVGVLNQPVTNVTAATPSTQQSQAAQPQSTVLGSQTGTTGNSTNDSSSSSGATTDNIQSSAIDPTVNNQTIQSNQANSNTGTLCKDGTISYSQHTINICSHHGGISNSSAPSATNN